MRSGKFYPNIFESELYISNPTKATNKTSKINTITLIIICAKNDFKPTLKLSFSNVKSKKVAE